MDDPCNGRLTWRILSFDGGWTMQVRVLFGLTDCLRDVTGTPTSAAYIVTYILYCQLVTQWESVCLALSIIQPANH